MSIKFYKFEGTGNDFIIIDNRLGTYYLNHKQIRLICDRRFGVGADGLMLYNKSKEQDFEMKYYNANGYEGSMCGNGGRSLIAFAHHLKDIKNETSFTAVDGLHQGKVLYQDKNEWQVQLHMTDVSNYTMDGASYVLDTGSPHYVEFVDNLQSLNVFDKGRSIRYNDTYKEEGINVNFVEEKDGDLFVRTYERGVENETYSCGTGVTASVLSYAIKNKIQSGSVNVQVLGGNLKIIFERAGDKFFNIWLEGPAKFVFTGEIDL
ncbi:MAG: diaminopimelate epimerase [Clostridia bacterium]|nr:diaminopimelate epimerase [Clostridia bacterium]